MVFCRTKRAAQRLADDLAERGFEAAAIHGDLSQVLREKALKRFRAGTVDVLVATDVAARGIDVEGVTHVINYECTDDDKTYVHRIGRTGRAGASGIAITFVDWADMTRWKVINNTLGLPFAEPQETYSTSEHLFHDLGIDRTVTGRLVPLPAKERPRHATEATTTPRRMLTGRSGGVSGRSGIAPDGGCATAYRWRQRTPRRPLMPRVSGFSGRRIRCRQRTPAETASSATSEPAGTAADSSADEGQATKRRRRRRRRGGSSGAGPHESAAAGGSADRGRRRVLTQRTPPRSPTSRVHPSDLPRPSPPGSTRSHGRAGPGAGAGDQHQPVIAGLGQRLSCRRPGRSGRRCAPTSPRRLPLTGRPEHTHPVADLDPQQLGEEADPLGRGVHVAGDHGRAERVPQPGAPVPPAQLVDVLQGTWQLAVDGGDRYDLGPLPAGQHELDRYEPVHLGRCSGSLPAAPGVGRSAAARGRRWSRVGERLGTVGPDAARASGRAGGRRRAAPPAPGRSAVAAGPRRRSERVGRVSGSGRPTARAPARGELGSLATGSGVDLLGLLRP